MQISSQLVETLSQMVRELLSRYEQNVPETGPFRDFVVARSHHFDDPDTTLAGRVELIVMHMDPRLDPKYDRMRFVSVRVMKSRQGGYSSMTCLHGSKAELRIELEALVKDASFLARRVGELADGLREETNPDVWR